MLPRRGPDSWVSRERYTAGRVTDDIGDDPRFHAALRAFDAEEFEEAADAFEELFFEAVRDEVPLVRALLQVSTGMHHVARGQRRAAVERLEEGLRVIETVTNARGVDLDALRRQVREAITNVRRG